MRTVIDSYNPEGVDEAVLRETGRGGLLADGFLREDPLESYLDDGEVPVFVRSNAKKGVFYDRPDDSHDECGRIAPGDGYRAFLLATDSRLLIVVGDTDSDGDGDWSVSIPLADVQLVDASESLLASDLAVTTLSGVRWRFPCTGDVAALSSYLDVATEAWKRLESHLDAAREHLLDASDRREAHAYDAAMESLDAAAAETDAARQREAEFVQAGVTAMDARIERADERIRDARRETFRARATHRLDRAERHWRDVEYGPAHESFRAAHADYAAALERTGTDFEESAALRKSLARVERNLVSLERAPVERADETLERAREAADPRERADRLERALERYRRALELDWGSDVKRFAGDTAEIRDRIDEVAADLVQTRRRVAAARVRAGDSQRSAGHHDHAAERYREARDLLDATLATARELVPDAADPVAEHREAIQRRLRCLDVDSDDPDATDATRTDPDGPDSAATGGKTDAESSPDSVSSPSDSVSSPTGGSVVSPT